MMRLKMNKEFKKEFKRMTEEQKFETIVNFIENLKMNFIDEEEEILIDYDIRSLKKLWKIYKKNYK